MVNSWLQLISELHQAILIQSPLNTFERFCKCHAKFGFSINKHHLNFQVWAAILPSAVTDRALHNLIAWKCAPWTKICHHSTVTYLSKIIWTLCNPTLRNLTYWLYHLYPHSHLCRKFAVGKGILSLCFHATLKIHLSVFCVHRALHFSRACR